MDDEMRNKIIRAMQIIAEAGECDCRTYHETCVKVLDLGLGSPASIKDYLQSESSDGSPFLMGQGNLLSALNYIYNYVTLTMNNAYCLELIPYVEDFVHAVRE